MKRKLTIFTFSLGFVILSNAQGINFSKGKNWDQIKAQAKAENKYIFVDVNATWCFPCKVMDEKTYPLKSVGDFFNEKFISVKVQMDTTKKDDLNITSWYATARQLGSQYQITVLPSFLFFAPNGLLISRTVGLKAPDELIAEAENAINPAKRYDLLWFEYQNGNRNPELVRTVARMANELSQKAMARKIAQDYINQLTNDELFIPDNLWFILQFTKTSSDRGFALFKDNAVKIEQVGNVEALGKIITVEESKSKVARIVYTDEIEPFTKSLDGRADWKKIELGLEKYGRLGEEILNKYRYHIIYQSEVEQYVSDKNYRPDWKNIALSLKRYGKIGNEILLKTQTIYALNHTNLQLLISAGNEYVEEYTENVAVGTLNSMAWMVFENSMKKSELKAALNWAKIAVEKEPKKHMIIDTYANLLHKTGNKKTAITWEEKALHLSPGNEEYILTLKRMKEGKATWPEVKNGAIVNPQ